MNRAVHALFLLMIFVLPATSLGQTLHVSETADEKALKITLHPAPEPRPALKYRLLPAMPDLIPGNAAVYYGKVTAEQMTLFSDGERLRKIHEWTHAPLEELRRDKVLDQVQFNKFVYYHLERGARCETCDWQLPIGEGDFYSILLPEIQQSRMFGRFLAARARAEIAEGKYDEAIQTLEIGYALGRHVAESECFVSGLVGVSFCGMMSRQVQDLIQQPGAPNLYWAMTRLPRPLIDMDRAAQAEMNAVYWTFPELQDAENSTQDAEYWRKTLLDFWQKFVPMMGRGEPWLNERPEALTAVCLKGYPMAKQALIDQGMPADRVEAMPVGQVVAIYTMRTYNDLRDDIFKWYYVPYWEAREKLREAELRASQFSRDGGEVVPLAETLLPAVNAVRAATTRTDREIALLRTLEALRLYGAAHGGQLPKTLQDVTEVPIPNDPINGQSFSYKLEGDMAVLEGPPLPGLLLRLEIRFAR